MAKKTDTTSKPTAPAKRAIKPTAAKTVAEKPAAPPAEKVAAPPAAKPKRAPKAAAPAKTRSAQDDVALRAYFISEKRRSHGLPGDEHQDWLEAERQILAENAKRKKSKKV